MTDKVQKNQIADILLDFYDEYDSNVINRPMIPNIYAGKILDSLKEEPVSDDLEKAADKYESEQQEKYKDRDNHDFDNYRDGFVDGLTHTYEAFMSGAKWQKKKTLKESEDAIQYVMENHSPNEVSDFQNAMNIAVMKAFDAGKEKMRELMMKNAIEGKVLANGMGNPILHLWDKGRHLIDKKVKVIVIKED